MIDFDTSKQIILFDGVCNLCDKSVQYIIKNDKKDVFRFVAQQSHLGQELIKYLGINSKNTDSIILYIPKKAYYIQYDAVLFIAKELRAFYYLLWLGSFFPTFIKNGIYNSIAKNRYKWFGKKETCMIPNPEIKSKFLE
ncbi:thiol-disulfide oxidoreductase DCC family protein [Flavobacterium croceum]|uniref:thiol-disulfide oxidoreductase DCC family protein n=1 Tax=Flavobacterium croceum TaxID=370975 RepID=UPI0024A94B3E|nr:DCC1-like thiol-disulfide oxidoreductase family protein [Flavobacterium croceum]